jgi:hypothetical protein
MGTQRVQIKGVLPCWSCGAGTRDFYPAVAALLGPVQSIFFLALHYFIIGPHRRAGNVGYLSLNMWSLVKTDACKITNFRQIAL